MKEAYNTIANICTFITVLTIIILISSILIYPFRLKHHKYKVRKFNREFPGDGPVFTPKYSSDYLEFKEPTFKTFYKWILSTNYKIKTLVLLCAMLGILNIYTAYYGNDTIGSIFSKTRFETRYYVQLFPEGSKSKNYMVPADLIVSGKDICLWRVQWPNGGYTTFNTFGDENAQEFYYDKKQTIRDDEGKEWTIILTNMKVK